jgi:hypothetical protein
MIVKEFLTQHLAPLQAHSRPLWSFKAVEDDLRLRPDNLSDEELSKVVRTLLGKDQCGPPDAHLPLYRRADGEKIAAAMPVFNERGLMPLEPSLPAGSPVPVSFGDPSREEGNGSSEATLEEVGETSPPRRSELLRAFSDDDADEHPVRESPRSVGVTTRSRGTPPKKLKQGVPKKDRSSLLPRGGASAPPSATATADPAAARSSAPDNAAGLVPTKPVGIALLKRTRDYVTTEQ